MYAISLIRLNRTKEEEKNSLDLGMFTILYEV